jgi:hypothetical protein
MPEIVPRRPRENQVLRMDGVNQVIQGMVDGWISWHDFALRGRVDQGVERLPHGFTIITRAMLGAGIALLLTHRLTSEQRKAVGATLAIVGLLTTIPAAWAVFGKCERAR